VAPSARPQRNPTQLGLHYQELPLTVSRELLLPHCAQRQRNPTQLGLHPQGWLEGRHWTSAVPRFGFSPNPRSHPQGGATELNLFSLGQLGEGSTQLGLRFYGQLEGSPTQLGLLFHGQLERSPSQVEWHPPGQQRPLDRQIATAEPPPEHPGRRAALPGSGRTELRRLQAPGCM